MDKIVALRSGAFYTCMKTPELTRKVTSDLISKACCWSSNGTFRDVTNMSNKPTENDRLSGR